MGHSRHTGQTRSTRSSNHTRSSRQARSSRHSYGSGNSSALVPLVIIGVVSIIIAAVLIALIFKVIASPQQASVTSNSNDDQQVQVSSKEISDTEDNPVITVTTSVAETTAPATTAIAGLTATEIPADQLTTTTYADIVSGNVSSAQPSNKLLLVGPENKLPDNFSPQLATTKDGEYQLDTEALTMLEKMQVSADEQTGTHLLVTSAYRTINYQAGLKSNKPSSKQITEPGHSEHHTGLAVDLYQSGDKPIDPNFDKSASGKWLAEHAASHGFILRYPPGKDAVTGIPEEAWHYRYVGVPHSVLIRNANMALEEYLNALEPGVFYQVDSSLGLGNIVISRQTKQELQIPTHATSTTVSPDNMGGYVITSVL